MYWIIGLFDDETEETIKKIWEELSVNSISFYSDEVKDARPHITFGSYYNLNKHEYIKMMDDYYDDKQSIKITFNTLGSFLNYQTLFLAPTITNELITFHSNHHKYFEKFNSNANEYYLPDQWIPHCTLANKISPEKLSEAFNYCLKRNHTIHGSINEIALLESVENTTPNLEAPIIFSKPLKLL
ncbi:2'-5' RNA ligase family protein [Pseudalkalibacillus caeni]|uniref:2'-5' RNA ligase family protein n=1 Tax=Exobacillus caeni TaxID=2574798 RepID=A0A5R9F5U2_9BACL|nr:2'-5' RNA ligase family protein [Pseudalkalibacillus caeni]TLS36183.1 2'-5' RNA ligase family protein [Pseudalkalibacillus caeni]